jgi:hypothetical protein
MRYFPASTSYRFFSFLLFATIGMAVSPFPYDLAAQDQPDRGISTTTFLQVSGISQAGEPRVFDDVVVFTYEQREFARYVAAAFEHEGYQELHVFTARKREGQSDLYYLTYPVTSEQRQLHYRLVVDGVWLTDPNAPKQRLDRNGVTVGTVTLNEPPPYERTSPRLNNDGTVTFYFALNTRISPTLETVDARTVSIASFTNPRISIAGTFNGWDPYLHRLTGPGPDGFYSVTIPVPAGPHHYYFLIDGQRILDPLNERRARDLQTGAFVSRIVVP